MSWKFFHNGYTWWLRIDNPEDLAKYCEAMDSERFGGAMMQVANHRMNDIKGHYSGIAGELDVLNRLNKEDLLTTTGKLVSEAHYTYFKNLARFGFVNINRLGGCNSSEWPMNAVIRKDELIFPTLGRKDVKIKTWEFDEVKLGISRSEYQYHWYAYIGDVQLKDGDKTKWDSKEECEAFVNKLFGKGE